jgi:hypothetical protein
VPAHHLFDELATMALAEFDRETRFRIIAVRGSERTGMAMLKLDRAYRRNRFRSIKNTFAGRSARRRM